MYFHLEMELGSLLGPNYNFIIMFCILFPCQFVGRKPLVIFARSSSLILKDQEFAPSLKQQQFKTLNMLNYAIRLSLYLLSLILIIILIIIYNNNIIYNTYNRFFLCMATLYKDTAIFLWLEPPLHPPPICRVVVRNSFPNIKHILYRYTYIQENKSICLPGNVLFWQQTILFFHPYDCLTDDPERSLSVCLDGRYYDTNWFHFLSQNCWSKTDRCKYCLSRTRGCYNVVHRTWNASVTTDTHHHDSLRSVHSPGGEEDYLYNKILLRIFTILSIIISIIISIPKECL